MDGKGLALQGLGGPIMKVISSAAILALTLAAIPAAAAAGQHQRRDGQPATDSQRNGDTEKAPAEQAQPQRARPEAPAASAPAPRGEEPRAQSPRPNGQGYAVPRTEPYRGRDNRTRGNRPVVVAPRYYSSGRYFYAPYRGYRPYSFRAQTSLRYFGIDLGYAAPYNYVYSYPVSVYGYGRPAAPVYINPSAMYYGGVSLELSPGDAEVWIDGTYAGWVEDFDGTNQPLTLMPGRHRIEVQAPGYEPLTLDVNVRPGEVVPYRGNLLPSRY